MSGELEKFGRKPSWPNASFRYFHGVTKESHGKSDDRQCTDRDLNGGPPE
jgi:hypothetical protein